MSPDHNTDQRSGSQPRQRSDARRNHDLVLAAADALLAAADSPASVTMDEVARAAGVGKGTLFRAFGDRSGLIRALWEDRYLPLRAAIVDGQPPFDDASPARDRIVAFADAIVVVKVDNRHLAIASEQATADPLSSPAYTSAHAVLVDLLRLDARQRPASRAGRPSAAWTAHAILAVLRADLLGHLLDDGTSPAALRRHVRATVTTLTA